MDNKETRVRPYFRVLMTLGAAAAMSTAMTTAGAQANWAPSKAVTIIVPVAPGSSNDLIARILTERLPARLGQPVVVENKPGAGAMIGTAAVARSTADGHTIGIAPSNIYIAPHLPNRTNTGVDVLKDLVPIITAGTSPVLIVAHPSVAAKTPKELVDFIHKSGGINYASSGPGSPMNVAGELFKRATKSELNHVPYRGVIPAVNAVMANELPIAFSALGGVTPFITSGKLVPIAVVEKQRSPLLPNVPTLTESGIAGVEVGVFFQMIAPAATPAAAIKRWNAEINSILNTPEVRERLRETGVRVQGGTSTDAAKLARDEYARLGRQVKDMNISGE